MDSSLESQPLTMQARTKVLFERIMLMAVGLGFIHFVDDLIFNTPTIWVTDIIVLTACAISYYLHKRGHELTGRIMAYVIVSVIIFYFAAGTHSRNSIHWHFFSIIVLTLIIFNHSNRLLGILLVIVISLILLWLEVNDYQLDWVPVIGDPHRNPLSVGINVIGSVAILVYAIVFLTQASESYEARTTQEIKNVQKLNKELDSFVYSASHDLKAPLSSLQGLLTLAKSEKDPAMLDLYMSKMETTISQSENFIKNITDYSRNVRLAPKLEEINLRQFLEELFRDMRFSNGNPTIQFKLSLDRDMITTDKSRMQAILGNLLSNCIKYKDPDKAESWIKISYHTSHQQHTIEVADNGIGIDEEHLPHLFDMFYRASERSSGSGLGLYIVQESLTKLGGSINVASTPKVGTTFTITLPTHNR